MTAKAFASKAQMERSRGLIAQGVITQAQFDESLAATKDHENLPERLHPKKEESKSSGKAKTEK